MSNRGFDRVRTPDPTNPGRGDLRGKRALFSTDMNANPTPVVIVACSKCGVERGLTGDEVRRLLRPPFLFEPFRRTLWAVCPSCGRPSRLRVRPGPALRWSLRPPTS